MKKTRIEIRLDNEEEKNEYLKIAKKEGYKTFSEFFRVRMKKDFSKIYRSQLNNVQIKSNPNEIKNQYLKFNVTQEDKILFTKKALEEGYENLSSFARERLKSSLSEDYKIEIDELSKIRLDTARTRQAVANLTSNINQTLKAYNSGEHPSKWIERDLSNRENLILEVKYLIKQNNEIIKTLDKLLKKRKN